MVNLINQHRPIPIQSEQEIQNRQHTKVDNRRINSSFSDILNQQLETPTKLSLSSHVEQRMRDRNIELSKQAMHKLESAVDKVAAKGSRESLIMMDDVSYIVNVPKRTVITAIDDISAKEKVFTNIDSAVIIK